MKGSSVNSCLHLLSLYQARPSAFPVENGWNRHSHLSTEKKSSILGYFVQFIVAAPDLVSTLAR